MNKNINQFFNQFIIYLFIINISDSEEQEMKFEKS